MVEVERMKCRRARASARSCGLLRGGSEDERRLCSVSEWSGISLRPPSGQALLHHRTHSARAPLFLGPLVRSRLSRAPSFRPLGQLDCSSTAQNDSTAYSTTAAPLSAAQDLLALTARTEHLWGLQLSALSAYRSAVADRTAALDLHKGELELLVSQWSCRSTTAVQAHARKGSFGAGWRGNRDTATSWRGSIPSYRWRELACVGRRCCLSKQRQNELSCCTRWRSWRRAWTMSR